MTAYGGVLSLRNTINNVICCSRFRLVGGSQQIIEGVYEELQPLTKVLGILDETSPSRSRKKVNALDGRIKEAFWRFEDSLESLLTHQIPSQSETLPEIVSIDLQSLENDANLLILKLKDMKEEYIYEVDNMPQDEPISSSFGFHGTSSKMIGLSDQFEEVKSDLLRFLDYPGWKHVYGLYGTAGVGKTTLAMKIYQDPKIQLIYKRRAWVTVGRVPQPISQISRGILAQLTQGDERRLRGKNCLIVLDDVWERNIFDCLNRSIPCVESGCVQVLLTCRHKKWIDIIPFGECNEVRFLNIEESMDLLCEKVFGDVVCPPQLHKSATKIAKLCEGLPLLILTVADILSKSEQNRNPVYWNEVAEKRNSVFTDAYNLISKVLFPSYDYLPQCLKMPFLFMGVFPYDTPPSKIIDMLTAEGLWDDWDCLRELAIEFSLVLRIWKSVDKTSHEFYVREYKTCRLHSSWRHVCRGEASKNKFYHVLDKLIDASEESLIGQRGLCLENNVLFGIKEFCDSIRLHCASFARSLLSYGPYHQYPIPIDVGFKLLREIDILTQRFYTFPLETLSLVHLKYLALTCNGEIPTTISKLFNLRVLIMHPHLNIRCCKAPSYVPIQIWDMQGLEHIEILGKSLVTSSHVNLYNLSTLVGVNASICTISELSRKIPNIKKLGIQIELTPYDDHIDLLSCFGCISTLSLDTLKLSITNPVIKHDHFFSVNPKSLKLPHYLIKLHLSGMGFPWEYMDAIGSLPYLQVLKLRSYAFQGPRWETYGRSFPNLEFLLIEESDLVQWKPGKSFPRLKYLSMKHCYKLVDICCYKGEPTFLDQYICTTEIELEDCNPLALIWASQLRPRVGSRLRVIASSSFDEKPTTVKFESLVGGSRQIMGVVYEELEQLPEILKRLDYTSPSRSRKKVNALDGRIKDAIWRFEDSLESLLTHHIPSQSQTLPKIVFVDLQSLQNHAHSLIETLNDMKKEYIYEVENMPQDEPISSIIGFHGTNSKMIGLSDQFRLLKTDLIRGSFSWNRVHALYGTAGIGKTTLAMQIYQDPQIQIVYQRRAWVTVGRVPQAMGQISQGILAQLSAVIKQGDEEIIDHCLKERSVRKNCLIVLDDVWEIEVVRFLIHFLPTIKNGYIHVLLTGRHRKWMSDFSLYEVLFLKEKESMDLLCEKVFGDEICPPQLHKPATKIAKVFLSNCVPMPFKVHI